MNIKVRSSARRLEVILRPRGAWINWLFGLLFLGAGALVCKTVGRSILISCGRDSGNCLIERRSLLRTTTRRFPAEDLEAARIDTSHGILPGSTLMVHTSLGDQSLVLLQGTPEVKDSLYSVIEGFVHDPQDPGFMIGEDTLRTGGILGSFLLGLGLLCIVAIERSNCVFDRDKGVVKVRNLRWLRLRRLAMPLDRLRDVDKESFMMYGSRSWSLILLFSGGLQVRLTTMPMLTDDSVDEAGRVIRTWLHGA